MNDSSQQEQKLLTFPCVFPMSVMGLNLDDTNTPAIIGEEIRKMDPSFDPTTIRCGYSRTKKYVSMKFSLNAQSQESLDAIYRMLTAHPLVKVVL